MTLLELLVSVALLGVLAGAVARSRGATTTAALGGIARGEARRQLRAAAAAVPATLRAARAGDLVAIADSVVELRATLGATALCAASAAGVDAPAYATVLLPGATPAVAAWYDAPGAGDELHVLALDAGGAWQWRMLPVAGAGAATGAPCLGQPEAPALRLPLAEDPPTLVAGAAVRLVRRVRWSVYRAGGRFHLGWRDVAADGGLDIVQPVSGPHDRRVGATVQPAIAFAALDSAGLATADPARTRIVELRATVQGTTAGAVPESVVVAAALRDAP